MVKKAAHPEFRLFEYLNGNLDETFATRVEAHLLVCDDCASVARLVRELKQATAEPNLARGSQVSRVKPQSVGAHPDLSELASFFYAKRAKSSDVASHVAGCSSCCEAIALYARGEHAAAEYNPASAGAVDVPATAWEIIRDWEDSGYAKVKPANEVLGQELLTRLAQILHLAEERVYDRSAAPQGAGRVPVLIVTSAGEVRSIEFFDKGVDSAGENILRHSEGSARFDNKPLLALFDFGEKNSFVVLNTIRRDTIRLEKARPEEEFLRTDYIIIED